MVELVVVMIDVVVVIIVVVVDIVAVSECSEFQIRKFQITLKNIFITRFECKNFAHLLDVSFQQGGW